MQDKKNIWEWMLTLFLLSIPIFNIVYLLVLIPRKNEIGTFAKAFTLYIVVWVFLVTGSTFLVIRNCPQITKNIKNMITEFALGETAEDKIISYEGKSPNSLTISNNDNREQYYGSDNTGYIRLRGTYNVYNIEPSQGLLAGIKIANETETYTMYRYSSTDIVSVEKGLLNAYQKKKDPVKIKKKIKPQGTIRNEIKERIDRIESESGMIGYIFKVGDSTMYIVGFGSEDIEWNIGSFTLTVRESSTAENNPFGSTAQTVKKTIRE